MFRSTRMRNQERDGINKNLKGFIIKDGLFSKPQQLIADL